MAKVIDLLDSINQKFSNLLSGLTATNVQDAIDEIDANVGTKIGAVQDDLSPILGGDLTTNNNFIRITNDVAELRGGIGVPLVNNKDVFFGNVTSDGGYSPTDGGILCQPGVLELGGSVLSVPALKDVEIRDVHVSEDGILFAAPLPQPGWEVSDTSTFDHSFGLGNTQGPWVEVVGLEINPAADVNVGDRVDIFVELYVENTQNKAGTIEIGIGINGVNPTVSGASVSVGPNTITYVPVSWSDTTHGGLVTTDVIDVFARRGVSDNNADLYLRGTTSPHQMIVSVPSAGGGGGSPTNLGNVPGPSSVTITSSTGANTVVAGAISGTAGVMTGAQVDTLASRIAATDVTYENLNNNGDVGPGSDQVAPGNHLHTGVYAGLASVNSFTAGNQFLGDFDVGDPGTETGSIQLDGVSYPAVGKFNRFGAGNTAEVVIHRHSTTDGSNLVFSRALSNDATHANVVNGTVLGDVQFSGWGDSSYWTGAIMRAVVDGTPGVSDMPSRLDFLTAPDASFTPTLRMSIRANGTVEVAGDMSVGGATITAAKIANWDAASTFIGLTDTPGSYAGQAGLFPRVNVTEDGLEFVAGGGGGIPEAPDNSFGYLREGPTSTSWVRGSRVFEQPTAPTGAGIGDVWIDTT